MERVSLASGGHWCVCVWEKECLVGSRGAWSNAMPPTVVYLGLVHAPLAQVDPQGALTQHSSISRHANLATMLWHPRFSSGPAFSLLSFPSPTPGLPRRDNGEMHSLVRLQETTGISLKREVTERKPGKFSFSEEDKNTITNLWFCNKPLRAKLHWRIHPSPFNS